MPRHSKVFLTNRLLMQVWVAEKSGCGLISAFDKGCTDLWLLSVFRKLNGNFPETFPHASEENNWAESSVFFPLKNGLCLADGLCLCRASSIQHHFWRDDGFSITLDPNHTESECLQENQEQLQLILTQLHNSFLDLALYVQHHNVKQNESAWYIADVIKFSLQSINALINT